MRIVYFWRGRSGQTVYASYKAAGSPVTADDMNEIKAFMESANRNIAAQAGAQINLQNQLVNVRTEARTALTNHNVSPDAHSDIRDAIAAEKSSRINADDSLQRQLNAEQTYRRALENQVADEIAARKLAVVQLQAQLNNEIDARELADTSLRALIDNLFTVDRQTFIDYVFGDVFTWQDIAHIFADDDELTGFTDADVQFVFND